MKSALEESIKEKIKALAKERKVTFAELWRNLILERFLARISHSPYKERFVLKGGTLLAKYIPLGRETQDLDFLIQKLSNTEESLKNIIREICGIDTNDSFTFELSKIKILDHSQLQYTGAEVTLQAFFGATKTTIRLDLGFGDRVNPIDIPINLTKTPKGPLFESKISLYCYPKEFIFAEKLETVVFRGSSNTRMKDFHDLYSLIYLQVLDSTLAKKAIQLVFETRKTDLKKIPIVFYEEDFTILEKNWASYLKKTKQQELTLPTSIRDVIDMMNGWLLKNRLNIIIRTVHILFQ